MVDIVYKGRRTGRTFRALRNLPSGSFYIVKHAADISYCKGLLGTMGRRSDEIRFIPLVQAVEKLRGASRGVAVDVDHYVFDSIDASQPFNRRDAQILEDVLEISRSLQQGTPDEEK